MRARFLPGAPHVQDPGQGESALVDEGAAGFDVEVVEVLEEERARLAAQDRRGEREEFVEVAGACVGAVARVEGHGPAHRAALVAQPVTVTAPGQGRATAETASLSAVVQRCHSPASAT